MIWICPSKSLWLEESFSCTLWFFPPFKEYFEDVYNNLYALACYFNNSEDKWVRNHFYERCFKIAQLIKVDGGKKEAEAYAHMGLLHEEDGEWELPLGSLNVL